MTSVGIIRCEKNEERCPLTNCLKSLRNTEQGFASYDGAELVGIFTCRCPGDNLVNLGKILKSKGAEMIHFCTCTFAHREEGKWMLGEGFCDHVDLLLRQLSREVGIPFVKGTAHLPEGYGVEVFKE
ncbi:MAG: hypothetical protein Kow0099_30690 [Candidatus Abyssubacteria bacterium]